MHRKKASSEIDIEGEQGYFLIAVLALSFSVFSMIDIRPR